MIVGAISFYLANFYFVNGAPFWTLFFLTPFTPLLDRLTPRIASFMWKNESTTKKHIQHQSI
jgi:hypothetical protein